MVELKVNLIISKDIEKECAIIKSSQLTDNIKEAIKYLENTGKSEVVAVKKNNKTTILNFKDIYMIRSENKTIKIYTENDSYTTNKRLYEFENQLDDSFTRISKSTIVNIKKIDHIAPSFKGIMFVSLINGLKDNITRSYMKEFKQKIGMM